MVVLLCDDCAGFAWRDLFAGNEARGLGGDWLGGAGRCRLIGEIREE